MVSEWSSTGRIVIDPPVGAICLHVPLESWSAIQLPAYREDDEGIDIWYHSYHLVGTGQEKRWVLCGLPELWRWRTWVRSCIACGTEYSNPWSPVCVKCWDSQSPYPSWDLIVRRDLCLEEI